MKVAELVDRGRFRLVDRPAAEPGPGEVQVRVDAVGVCGSDLHNFSEGSVGDMPSVYPMVLGHEPAGTVVRAGSGVAGWAPGDRALLEPAIYCYHCEYCRSGRHNVCARLRFLSQPGEPGFFRELVNLPAANLLPLPQGLGPVEGTLFEPLAVVLHSLRFADLRPAERAVVFGAGPIGLLTIAALKLAGAGRIWAVEPVAARRELACAVGADAALTPADARTAIRGADVAIDCATKGDSTAQCLEAVRSAGRVVITGIPSEPRVAVDFHLLRRKELTVYSVRRSNRESELALELLSRHRAAFAPIITHSRPVEEIEPAFRMLEAYRDGVGKLVILVGRNPQAVLP